MSEAIQISVKVSPRTLTRAEDLRAFLSEEGALDATRADVLRRAIALGLRALERSRSRGAGAERDDELDEDDEGEPLAPGMIRAVLESTSEMTTLDLPAPPPNVVDHNGRFYRRVGGTNESPQYVAGSRPEGRAHEDDPR